MVEQEIRNDHVSQWGRRIKRITALFGLLISVPKLPITVPVSFKLVPSTTAMVVSTGKAAEGDSGCWAASLPG